MKETNPIEQRIVALADRWKECIEVKNSRVVRLYHKEDENQMIDAFIWYMLGIDSSIDDIAFILDPLFTDIETYSEKLLSALSDIINEWNNTPKNAGIEDNHVNWKPDYNLADKENPASLFVRNFNMLSETLNLEKGKYTVATLLFPHINKKKKDVGKWMEYAIQEGISPRVKVLLSDTEEYPVFDRLNREYPEEVVRLIPKLDMDNVIKQLAAMGDPAAPSTPYRIAFVNMMAAMTKNNSREASKHGNTCIRIAKENSIINPHWAVQVVVVYMALANDRLKMKDEKGAGKQIDKAIEAAENLPDTLGKDVILPVTAQAYMTRGSISCYPKNWENALPDFSKAASLYSGARNTIMGIEAYRMAGFCAAKSVSSEEAVEYLAAGFRLARQANREALLASSFSALLKQLINKNYQEHLSYEEIAAFGEELYGEDWEDKINHIWKYSPDAELLYEETNSVTRIA